LPGESIEKLSAIIPPPKSHLVKWSGVFAPGSPYRKRVVLKPEVKKGRPSKKVFRIDVTKCQHCQGDIAILAAITNRSEVARYLKHLGLEHEAPARAPPRYQEEPFEFGTIEDLYESLAIIS
jgi:hypothetical protein